MRGTVTRLADFGAFVELEPGVEGLIHVSEMSWSKKVRKPSDAVKSGETVEAVILGVNVPERRISLGLKQALGDPWIEAAKNFTIGSVVEGPVVERYEIWRLRADCRRRGGHDSRQRYQRGEKDQSPAGCAEGRADGESSGA